MTISSQWFYTNQTWIQPPSEKALPRAGQGFASSSSGSPKISVPERPTMTLQTLPVASGKVAATPLPFRTVPTIPLGSWEIAVPSEKARQSR